MTGLDATVTNNTSAKHPVFQMLGGASVAALFLYLLNHYLQYWHDWPSLVESFILLADTGLTLKSILLWVIQITVFFGFMYYANRVPDLNQQAQQLVDWAYFWVRACFWAVVFVGLADALVSFLRVENLTTQVLGDSAKALDQAVARGLWLHYPLMALAIVCAFFTRTLGFHWLAVLVVLAEFGIVLSRFIFSYEQAFMGDLVRFWYASLFLFASAYTLVEGGHVRVDVLYANLSSRAKAWVNLLGSVLLGLPLCWTILMMGMGSRQSSLISPIINFEISQSGYGLFVKYLMAGFLIVFAATMILVFTSYVLSSLAVLLKQSEDNIIFKTPGDH